MATKQNAALKRLVQKLSAMRVTLSNDEREILDKLIVGEEVAAHRLTTGAAKAVKAVKGEAEVAAHKMTSGSARAMKAVKADAEVAAHKMTGAIESKRAADAREAQAAASSQRIVFDPATGSYKINDRVS